jgi:hypothetical protein
MPEDARFLVATAVDYAERRASRLRALTVSAGQEAIVEHVREELQRLGLSDVEIVFEAGENGLRLVSVEVESAG